jgi:uncharacterized protein YdaU (DUF1376 family)
MASKVDIWMPLYIGDILADTSHLDAERFGCYMLWLMHYWRKGPLSGNLADLVGIGKLRCVDATSTAQALLNEFFSLYLDGKWHQKRADVEIAKWQDKSLKAQEKAKTAAEARWGKDATSNATGTPQALLAPCPSSLPSSSPLSLTPPLPPEKKTKKQKPSSMTKKEKAVDPRRKDFIEDLQSDWKCFAKTKFPFDGSDGTQVDLFLKAWPELNRHQWRDCLRNRRNTPGVIPTERIYRWIPKLANYLNGALTEYGKLNNGGNNAAVSNGTGNQIMGVLKETLERRQRNRIISEDGDLQTSGEAGPGDPRTLHAIPSAPRLASVSGGDEGAFNF